MITLDLKTRGTYSRVLVFPPFLRKMVNWTDDVSQINIELKGSTITLTPIIPSPNVVQQTMVKNDTKKTIKLEKKKRA
jgi:hypothetical protein